MKTQYILIIIIIIIIFFFQQWSRTRSRRSLVWHGYEIGTGTSSRPVPQQATDSTKALRGWPAITSYERAGCHLSFSKHFHHRASAGACIININCLRIKRDKRDSSKLSLSSPSFGIREKEKNRVEKVRRINEIYMQRQPTRVCAKQCGLFSFHSSCKSSRYSWLSNTFIFDRLSIERI